MGLSSILPLLFSVFPPVLPSGETDPDCWQVQGLSLPTPPPHWVKLSGLEQESLSLRTHMLWSPWVVYELLEGEELLGNPAPSHRVP